jgi:DNA-binding NarL/FixJ family response regulator
LVIYNEELISTALTAALRGAGVEAHSLFAADLDDFLIRAVTRPAGLVVLDMDLGRAVDVPVISGVHLVKSLRARGWKVLVIGDDDEAGVAAAVASGAVGAVPKSRSFRTLLRTVTTAAEGGSVMTEVEHQRWLRRHRQHAAQERELALRVGRLTPREREVLALLASGMRAALIAEHLVVSMPTVRSQIRSILTKLQVGSQLEAVAMCRRQAELISRPAFAK